MEQKLQDTFLFIREFIRSHGYSPTVREIKVGVGIKGTTTAWEYLVRLCDLGLMTMQYKKPRTIVLTEE